MLTALHVVEAWTEAHASGADVDPIRLTAHYLPASDPKKEHTLDHPDVVVWADHKKDVALLEVEGIGESTGIAKLCVDRSLRQAQGFGWVAYGFPEFAADGSKIPSQASLLGSASHAGEADAPRLQLTAENVTALEAVDRERAWGGMSGAAVFGTDRFEGQVIGVIRSVSVSAPGAAVRFSNLEVVPVFTFAREPTFCAKLAGEWQADVDRLKEEILRVLGGVTSSG